MSAEDKYIKKRLWKAGLQSILFYLFRIFPVQKKKIVFCCIEGTTGYSCNPKYIAEEFLKRNSGYELVWLVNDISKKFPDKIKVVRNTLLNRAYHLSTARFWIDNSRKQLEVRKRKSQIYIQTWHAKLGFKPTCLDRGQSFSQIAYLVSKHDSDMIDFVLSNSKWYDDTLPTGMIYDGPVLRTGSPRCDILIKGRELLRKRIRKNYNLPKDVHILMYAPTFRGGSQETNRTIEIGGIFSDYERLIGVLEEYFKGKWYIFLRLHPQLAARNFNKSITGTKIIDISQVDDMYEILAACDVFMTDYSSAAFDAAIMKIPVFLYADDYEEYEKERGKLLWDMRTLPFPLSLNIEQLEKQIGQFDEAGYQDSLKIFFEQVKLLEDGNASKRVCDFIESIGG